MTVYRQMLCLEIYSIWFKWIDSLASLQSVLTLPFHEPHTFSSPSSLFFFVFFFPLDYALKHCTGDEFPKGVHIDQQKVCVNLRGKGSINSTNRREESEEKACYTEVLKIYRCAGTLAAGELSSVTERDCVGRRPLHLWGGGPYAFVQRRWHLVPRTAHSPEDKGPINAADRLTAARESRQRDSEGCSVEPCRAHRVILSHGSSGLSCWIWWLPLHSRGCDFR